MSSENSPLRRHVVTSKILNSERVKKINGNRETLEARTDIKFSCYKRIEATLLRRAGCRRYNFLRTKLTTRGRLSLMLLFVSNKLFEETFVQWVISAVDKQHHSTMAVFTLETDNPSSTDNPS